MRDHRSRSRSTEPAPPAPEAQGDGEPASGERQDASADDGAARNADADETPSGESDAPDQPAASDSALEQQLADQRDRYLRLAAEYDNFRKRTARERAEGTSRAQAELVSRLLDALDDLSRFAHIDPATTDPQTLHKGIDLVEQKVLKALTAAGLEVIDPLDQTFDPTVHEAITTETALSPEDDHTVAKVFQKGYRFNGQLLRPARVVVKQWNG
jgi:molecular chaperone GrpE